MIYLVKNNNGFAYSAYDNFLPDNIKKTDVIEVDEATLDKLTRHELMWNKGTLVNNPNYTPITFEEGK